MSHQFRSLHGGKACLALVSDGIRGDLCGRPADHPVHSVNDDLDAAVDRYVEANNLVALPPGVHEQMHREAALPYAGTSGWSGSETSQAATVDQDNDGRTLDKQQETLRLLNGHRVAQVPGMVHQYVGRSNGMTYRELDVLTGWGHGSVSRVLSDLHKAGLLARLSEERGRCKVYVLPEYVGGRETEPHGGRGGDRLRPEERAVVNTLRRGAGAAAEWPSSMRVVIEMLDRLAPEPKGDR